MCPQKPGWNEKGVNSRLCPRGAGRTRPLDWLNHAYKWTGFSRRQNVSDIFFPWHCWAAQVITSSWLWEKATKSPGRQGFMMRREWRSWKWVSHWRERMRVRDLGHWSSSEWHSLLTTWPSGSHLMALDPVSPVNRLPHLLLPHAVPALGHMRRCGQQALCNDGLSWRKEPLRNERWGFGLASSPSRQPSHHFSYLSPSLPPELMTQLSCTGRCHSKITLLRLPLKKASTSKSTGIQVSLHV